MTIESDEEGVILDNVKMSDLTNGQSDDFSIDANEVEGLTFTVTMDANANPSNLNTGLTASWEMFGEADV
ncbi:hypothetical protein ABLE94_09050 [Gordonia sp. VNK1]|uniref:hypothetical protein n=1 Tax=Gordonia oleivorans TaxID=3156618 RepID=UPI0032B43945